MKNINELFSVFILVCIKWTISDVWLWFS